jgi:hypothetical protein
MAQLYNVRLTFEAPESGQQILEALREVFAQADTARLATPHILQAHDRLVTVEFQELAAETPVRGAEYTPPRSDEPLEDAGRQAIEHLREMPSDVLLPTMRALISTIAARVRAGLPARQHITIEVEPASVHAQDELRHNWTGW